MLEIKFLRNNRKRKYKKKLFYKDFSKKMSPTLIHYLWRSYSFWSALMKSSLMMVGKSPFNLASPLYLIHLILLAIYFENPNNPHDVRFPNRSNPFLQLIRKYWKSWKCRIFSQNFVENVQPGLAVLLSLPAKNFGNNNPHDVLFPKRSNPFLQLIGKYWKSWKCRFSSLYFVENV